MAIEIMSPAGTFEALIAASRAGCDAVYFGLGDFNARRGAKNIGMEELPEALKYLRLRGVKSYVTVNTLLSDLELLEVKGLIEKLSELGCDAVIVQDLGVARLVRSLAPELPMFASTQLSVHNLDGALAAQKLGFSRVVLARELPMHEIEYITKNCGIETEVFLHGALCMSHSGQCYMSSLIGGRSGNRGMCAQPCRQPYSFFGGGYSYPLSLKDLYGGNFLFQLEEAGVASLKIEGRMKRPEYVALVTKIYKDALQRKTPITRAELEDLRNIFSRDGFTDGYLKGDKGESMFGIREDEDAARAKFLYKKAREIYKSEPEHARVRVDFDFVSDLTKSELFCRDEQGCEYSIEGQAAELAQNRPTQKSDVAAALKKTGGTVFYPGEVRVRLEPGVRLSAAVINAMRRTCLEGLEAKRKQPKARTLGDWQPGVKRLGYKGEPKFIYSFLKFEQITKDILKSGPELIYLPLKLMAENLDKTAALIGAGVKVAPVLDRIIFDESWPMIARELQAVLKLGAQEIVCTNLGQVSVLSGFSVPLRGDFGLNAFNSQSLKELKALGLSSQTLSFELNFAQIKDLSQPLDCELIVYGRLPLMITENCVIKLKSGTCLCEGNAPQTITDRTGHTMPLLPERDCRNTVLNADKLYLADKLQEIRSLNVKYLRLNFTTENSFECEQVVKAYVQDHDALPPERVTRGLYYRKAY